MDPHLQPRYDELHRALGDLVRQWAWMEHGVSNLIFDLAAIKSESFYDDINVGSFYTIVVSNIDLRTSISIAKALAFDVRNEAPLFDEIEALLNEIANDLRNKRNRYVHDQWMVSAHNQIVRFQLGTKLKREPGTGDKTLELTTHERFASIGEIEQVANRIHQVRIALNDLSEQLQDVYRLKFHGEE